MSWITNPYRFGSSVLVASNAWSVLTFALSQSALATLEMSLLPGGADLTSGRTTLCSSNVTNSTNIHDGSTFTYANQPETNMLPVFFGASFAAPVLPTAFRLKARSDEASVNQAPRLILVRRSIDGGTTWIPVEWFSTSSWTNGEEKEFVLSGAPIDLTRTGAYLWRVYMTAFGSGSNQVEMRRLSMCATSGGANLLGSTNIPIAQHTRNYANGTGYDAQALIGIGNWWYSHTIAGDKWVGGAFAAPQDLAEIAITAQNGTDGNSQFATAFDFQWSADGENWTTTDSYSSQTFVNFQQRVYTVS